jgi:hypothetical protein
VDDGYYGREQSYGWGVARETRIVLATSYDAMCLQHLYAHLYAQLNLDAHAHSRSHVLTTRYLSDQTHQTPAVKAWPNSLTLVRSRHHSATTRKRGFKCKSLRWWAICARPYSTEQRVRG